MRFLLCVALLGCSPEYQVILDGQPVDGLAEAAQNAVPGSVIELEARTYAGGIELPDDVTILGHGATIQGTSGRLVSSVGTLTLRDLTLVGGSDDEGSAVRAEALMLEAVSVRDGTGAVALWADASIDASDTDVQHDGIAVMAISPLGRARTVTLERFVTNGDLQVEADRAVLTDVTALQITTGGLSTRLDRTTSSVLSVRGRAVQLFGTQADLGATIAVDDVVFSELSGGAWTITGNTVSGVGLIASQIAMTADQLVLGDLTAQQQIQLVATERAELFGLNAPLVDVSSEALTVDDVQANQLSLIGLGPQTDLRITGASPSLSTVVGTLQGVIVHATSGVASVTLSGASVTNLLVVEPPTSVAPIGIQSPDYANVHQSTLVLGRRTSLTDLDSPVFFEDCVIQGHALGDIVGRNTWEDTVAWSETEALSPRLGLSIEDPLFLAPGNPELNPLSDWTDAGAFAGPGGPALLARWRAL